MSSNIPTVDALIRDIADKSNKAASNHEAMHLCLGAAFSGAYSLGLKAPNEADEQCKKLLHDAIEAGFKSGKEFQGLRALRDALERGFHG